MSKTVFYFPKKYFFSGHACGTIDFRGAPDPKGSNGSNGSNGSKDLNGAGFRPAPFEPRLRGYVSASA